jgi:hypothetical protein
MKELSLVEFEDEVARFCGSRDQNSRTFKCGSGYCKQSCQSIPKVREWLKGPENVGVVLFLNQDLCSSQMGKSSCMVVGENRTFKTIEECDGKWLNDLPSQRQYAVCCVRRAN